MTTIFLHGYLRDLHPEPISVEANSAAEALSALQLVPAIARTGRPRHHVRIQGYASRDALYDRREVKELHVYPLSEAESKELMVGSGRPGVSQIIIGALLITAAIMGGLPSLGITSGMLYFSGAMMILGGILQLLSPQPKIDNTRSRYLGGGKNTVAIGTKIPLIYGRVKAYGQYISFNVDAGSFDGAPASWYSSPYTDYGTTTYSAAPAEVPLENPQGLDQNPTSTFRGLTYPEAMVAAPDTFITFDAVVLLAGEYDLNFSNGKTLHVENMTAGTTTQVTLRGGEVSNMPEVGTNIVFTRNYG